MGIANPHHALNALRARMSPVAATLDRLREISGSATVLGLFRDLFPVEYGQLKSFSWRDQGAVRQAAVRFYELVDQRLFPCTVPWDGEEFAEAWADQGPVVWFYCPFPAYYEEVSWERAIDDFPLADRAILAGAGRVRRCDHGYEEVPWDQHPSFIPTWQESLEAACEARRPAALRLVPDAVRFLLKASQNFWIDLTEEEVDFASDLPDWGRELVDDYAAEWQLALEIHRRVEQLRKWVGASDARARLVERLVAEAVLVSPAPKRARVRIVSSAALVETLGQGWTDLDDEEDTEDL